MGFDWMAYNSGDWGGLMVSRDSGTTWAMVSEFPANYYITAILMLSAEHWVVSARAHFHDKADGGVWVTTNGGTDWTRTLKRPVYDLAHDPATGSVLAALPWAADDSAVLLSQSGGTEVSGWEPFAAGISWDGRTAFYPTFAVGNSTLFIGALTVNPLKLSDTASAVYSLPLSDLTATRRQVPGSSSPSSGWSRVPNAPPRLDRDAMPKDRMALLVHPHDDSMLFVAGNADALVWRVDWKKGVWVESSDKDTSDGSYPHADCRSYFWQPESGGLILLSDGGAFLRTNPEAPGGKWRSLAGNTGAMELVGAHWDPIGKRWVGGAQDNTVMRSPVNVNGTVPPLTQATGFIFGDGTVTAVDSSVTPGPRLWGSTQFLGNFADDDAGPHLRASGANDDDTNYGFGFWLEGTGFVGVPLLKWFSVLQFPFFVQPFALDAGGSDVFFYAASGAGSEAKLQAGGIYRLSVPPSARKPSDVPVPTLELATGGHVYALVAGGVTAGKPDPSVLIGMNATHLVHRSATSGASPLTSPLPVTFAAPIGFEYTKDAKTGEWSYTLGPTSHDRTVSLAASPANSQVVAVSGWTSVVNNEGREGVWLSTDAGRTFVDATSDLRNKTGTIGQIRPSALLLLPTPRGTVLLVGTVSGVFIKGITNPGGVWSRLGSCDELPLVLVAGLSYEPKDDTLVAATMGRGIYVLHEATAELAKWYLA